MMNTYTCAYCADQLAADPIKTSEGLALPCSNCGALNLFPNIFKLVKQWQ